MSHTHPRVYKKVGISEILCCMNAVILRPVLGILEGVLGPRFEF